MTQHFTESCALVCKIRNCWMGKINHLIFHCLAHHCKLYFLFLLWTFIKIDSAILFVTAYYLGRLCHKYNTVCAIRNGTLQIFDQ